MPPSPKKYRTTVAGVNMWAVAELAHVGRIIAIEDPDVQYAYAQSTVNGMLHLRNAIYELLHDKAYVREKEDLSRLYGQVNRAVIHLVKDFGVDLSVIAAFNSRGVLGDISNVGRRALTRKSKTRKSKTRKSKTRKSKTKRN
jgi:hypothetical protein